MKGIVIRFSANKREVGILKTSFRSKERCPAQKSHAKDEGGKYSCDNDKKYVSLKIKCFGKYRSVEEKFNDSEKESENKPDINNNMGKCGMKHVLGRKKYEEIIKKAEDRLATSLKNEMDKKNNLIPKTIKRIVKEKNCSKDYLNYPCVKSAVKKLATGSKQNSSTVKSKRKHPNRRLQRERPETDPLPVREPIRSRRPIRSVVVAVVKREPVTEGEEVGGGATGAKVKVEESHTERTKHGASGMWEKVLESAAQAAWEEEAEYIKRIYTDEETDTESEGEGDVDYAGLLEDYVLHSLEANRGMGEGKTCYERRVEELMAPADPQALQQFKEFYIPPALVEVLYQNMAQDTSAEESLRRICEVKKWPEPEFICKQSGKGGFVYSCTLKSKTFNQARPASNEELAKELAALECLKWLGFQQKPSLGKPSIEETYFS